MDLSSINEEKIVKINEGLWTINRYSFYVEIDIQNDGDNQFYKRLINQNELTAIQTQITLSNLQSEGNFQIFYDQFKKIGKYRKIIKYLNLQGIPEFVSINKKKFSYFENAFDDHVEKFNSIIKNNKKIVFYSNYIQHSAFRRIGKSILEYLLDKTDKHGELLFQQLTPYVKCVFGKTISRNLFDEKLKKFLESQSELNIHNFFDSVKLGYNFCMFFSNLKNLEFGTLSLEVESLIRETKYLNFVKEITDLYKTSNLMFFKVQRPAHCYHCIKSTARIIEYMTEYSLNLNEKSLIFCQSNSNFAERISQISKTSVNDSDERDSSMTYFIVHPEMLNEKDHSFLVEFLNARLNSLDEKDLSSVIIISSLDYKSICYKHQNKIADIEFKIDKEKIEYLRNLSFPDEPNDYRYQLYYSENAGAGKTFQILDDFKNKKGCIEGIDIIKYPHVLESVFIDVDTKTIPKLTFKDNNEEKDYQYVHFDFSPDLFDNNYKFFDDLWVFSILHYQINSDGTTTRTPANIFFEVPTLTRKQYQDGGFISAADFPIYVNNYNKISSTQMKDGKETLLEMKLNDKVKKMCDSVFKKKIEHTSKLLEIMCRMFYPQFEIDKKKFVPRILEEINTFLEEFCKNLNPKNKLSQKIFLLLLRTNFQVWNMESLFDKKEQPKSFIIMSNKNLFGTRQSTNEWILLCFSSKDEKDANLEWNLDYLKDSLKNLGPVVESRLLKSNMFKELTKQKENIEIYSNHHNYINDQAYFFSIIQKFFYQNNNKEAKYCRITDGVILNNFKNSDYYENVGEYLLAILQGKEAYENAQKKSEIRVKQKVQWTKTFDLVKNIFENRNESEPECLINEMTNNDTVRQISDITLTMTLVKRFIVMILRIILKHPLIFEGFTGVGKTWSCNLLKTLIDLCKENDDFKWSYHQLDCHGALQLVELSNFIKDEIVKTRQTNLNHIFFLDELNTSPISNYVINEMNNYYLMKKYYFNKYHKKGKSDEHKAKGKFNEESIVFMAAINPYIKVDKFTRNLSRVGIKQIIPSRMSRLKLCNITSQSIENFYEVTDLNKLAYNVRELAESTKMIVLKSDPELFFFDESDRMLQINNECSLYLPPDEIKTIGHIIKSFLTSLIGQIDYYNNDNILRKKRTENQDSDDTKLYKNGEYYVIKDNKMREENLRIIESVLTKKKQSIQIILQKTICKSILEIRELMQLKSILSFRDVKRLMQFFLLFFRKLVRVYFKRTNQTNITEKILIDKIIPQSIVLSMMISIVFRFSNETRIETSDGNIGKSIEEEERILSRCQKFGLKMEMSSDFRYFKVNTQSVLLEKLMGMDWESLNNDYTLRNPTDWKKIVISYAWLKCKKYIYTDLDDIYKNACLFKLNSLMTHLFAISSCYSACRNNKNCVIPCLIIGMPGTSKTLAIQLFIDYKQSKQENQTEPNFFSTIYLSTRVSEAEGLNAHYRDCATFMMTHRNSLAVCVIDELGLANLNETRPLKLLHYYFDKGIKMDSPSENISIIVPVMSIAASNYALDYANMNRGILVCTDLPTDQEISEAFYFSQLEASEPQITEKNFRDYIDNYFCENEFFSWKEDKEHQIEKYNQFLKILWKLTKNKQRPEMLTLRPLYLLFNTIFHNRLYQYDDKELIDNLRLYLTSAISCNPSDSIEKTKLLLSEMNDLNIIDSKNKIEFNQSNMHIFQEIFNGPRNNKNYVKFCSIIKKKLNDKLNKLYDYFDRFTGIVNDKKAGFDRLCKIFRKASFKNRIYYALNKIYNSKCFNALAKRINDKRYDNYKNLRQSIIANIEGKQKRAFCFRTKNYECLDFIEDLLEKTTFHYLNKWDEYEKEGKMQNIEFVHIYPSDFQLSRQISADNAIETFIDIIRDNNKKKGTKEENDTIYYMLIVGNVCLADALLDLLNSPDEGKGQFKTKKPLISRNGFSIELDEFPKNIVFCFIMNEKDFHNRNSVDSFPVPLLDRLNQLYFDYDQRDEFGVIEEYQNFYKENQPFATPYASIIHDYFNHFIKDPRKIKVDKDHYAVCFASSDISRMLKENIGDKNVPFNDWDLDDEIPWVENVKENNEEYMEEKIIILKYFNGVPEYEIRKDYNENLDHFKNKDKIIKGTRNLEIYCTTQFDHIYEFNKNNKDCQIPYPKPSNYTFLENDGSINTLIKKVLKEEKKRVFKAIILTTTPMMEDIQTNDYKIIKRGLNGKENTEYLFDQYIPSSKVLKQKISESNKNVVIQLNHFQIEHDRYLRYLLEEHAMYLEDKLIEEEQIPILLIIYHLKNSQIPEGLYSSRNWPVYWIESISNSPLSMFPTIEIVNHIRFNEYYKDNEESLYIRIISQVYNDTKILYEKKIDEDKKATIFDTIFTCLKNKKDDNQISILDSVSFEELIDKFEGKKVNNSYKNLDFKRDFCNIIRRKIPFLNNLIKLLILNFDSVNGNDIEDTKKFIKDLIELENIEQVFEWSEIDKIDNQQSSNCGLYFPELIFPQVIKFYEVFDQRFEDEKKKKESEEEKEEEIKKPLEYPKFNLNAFNVFFDFNMSKGDNNSILKIYLNNYFQSYISKNMVLEHEKHKKFVKIFIEEFAKAQA